MKIASVSSNRIAIAALAAAALLFGAVTTTSAAAQSHDQRSASTALAPAVNALCITTATRTKVSRTSQSTNLTTYVDVIDTQIGFHQGGTSASCVVVSFSAEATATTNQLMIVDPLLDSTPCQPGDTQFANSITSPDGLAARAMNYVCPNVAPGNHTVKVRFKSSGGGPVSLNYRTTIVQYAK
jgi:hypothetical protein